MAHRKTPQAHREAFKESLEALRTNLEEIFKKPVSLEQARLVAAAVNVLNSVGFELDADEPEDDMYYEVGNPATTQFFSPHWSYHGPPGRDKKQYYHLSVDKRELRHLPWDIQKYLAEVLSRHRISVHENFSTGEFCARLTIDDYTKMMQHERVILIQVFGEGSVLPLARAAMERHMGGLGPTYGRRLPTRELLRGLIEPDIPKRREDPWPTI